MRSLEARKVVMCKRTRELGRVVYDIEIAIAQGKMLLSAQSRTSAETIVVDIPADKSIDLHQQCVARQILSVFEGDYDLLMEKLQISDNKLMIIAPAKVLFNSNICARERLKARTGGSRRTRSKQSTRQPQMRKRCEDTRARTAWAGTTSRRGRIAERMRDRMPTA